MIWHNRNCNTMSKPGGHGLWEERGHGVIGIPTLSTCGPHLCAGTQNLYQALSLFMEKKWLWLVWKPLPQSCVNTPGRGSCRLRGRWSPQETIWPPANHYHLSRSAGSPTTGKSWEKRHKIWERWRKQETLTQGLLLLHIQRSTLIDNTMISACCQRKNIVYFYIV